MEEPPYPSDLELELMGAPAVALGFLNMVFATPEWIHRRAETITFVGESHRRRRVSLDFTIPNPSPSQFQGLDGKELQLIPLDVLEKHPLRGFDCLNEDGRPLPVLTRRQNGQVAWRGMVAMANSILQDGGHAPLSPSGEELLRRVTQLPYERANRYLTLFEVLAARRPDAKLLAESPGFGAAVRMLARNFLLVSPLVAMPGERRIIKFSYEEPHDQTDRRSRRERLSESLGWSPTTIEIPVPSFADCESYHLEALAPDGVDSVDVVLGDETRVVDGAIESTWAVGYSRLISDSRHRAHVSVNRTSDPESDADEFLQPTINLTLQVARTGWMRAAGLMSAAVTVLMVASLPFVINLDAGGEQCAVPSAVAFLSGWLCGAPEANGPTTDPAALLAALVGVVSVVILRTGEHAYTANRVRPLRYAAFSAAFVPLAAAWVLTFVRSDQLAEAGWWILTGTSAVASVLLVSAWRLGER